MKKKNNKSIVAIIAVLAILAVVGGTLAYYTSSQSFDNIFRTKPYSTKFEEVFESPNDWTPGTTTSKEVFATNTGEVDVAVRVSFTEEWVSANGTTLSGTQGANKAAIINLANTSDWTKVGDYYVYNRKLTNGQRTSSFLESVTFNENITADVTCTEVGTTKNCVSSGNGYDGATYTLRVTIETIQYDAAADTWGLNSFTWKN